MPPEPDNKMDDLLKTYAKKRRDEAGAPIEMHPVTRRLLQAEAAKLRPATPPPADSWLDSLKRFWPRLAVAAALVLVVGITAVTFFGPANHSEKAMQFAKQEPASSLARDGYGTDELRSEAKRALAPPPAQPPGEKAVLLRDQITPARREAASELRSLSEAPQKARADMTEASKKLKEIEIAKNEPRSEAAGNRDANAVITTAPAAPASVTAEAAKPVQLGAIVAQSTDKLDRGAAGPPSPTATTLTVQPGSLNGAGSKEGDALAIDFKAEKPATAQLKESEAVAGFFSKAGVEKQSQNAASARSRFANVQQTGRPQLGKGVSAADTTVLANFVVEQSGEQLRVVDADGSVYNGRVLTGDPTVVADLETALNLNQDARRNDRQSGLAKSAKDAKAQAQSNSADSPAAPAWNFRVSGTNRTLRQPVIVEGVLYEALATNSAGQAGAEPEGNISQVSRTAPSQAPAQQNQYRPPTPALQNSAATSFGQSPYSGQSMKLLNAYRIQGQVRVGSTNQVPLDAMRDGR